MHVTTWKVVLKNQSIDIYIQVVERCKPEVPYRIVLLTKTRIHSYVVGLQTLRGVLACTFTSSNVRDVEVYFIIATSKW